MKRLRQTNTASVVLRHLSQPDEPGSNLQIEVNRVRWRDLSFLRRPRKQILLNQPYGYWLTGDPFQAGMRQLMPLIRSVDRVAVARGDGRPLGHAVFRVNIPDDRWTLESVGSSTGVYQSEPIWEELFRYSVMAAGLEGAKRLYAKLPVGSSLIGSARKTGFAPYATEHVWTSSDIPAATACSDVRRQSASDVWSIHQLYMAAVPRQVQYAEAITSHHWDANARVSTDERVTGWLFEDGNQILGYVRVTTRPDRHVLEFIVNPDHRDVAHELLQTAFAQLAAMPRRTVFAVVRSYQFELLLMLERAGLTAWQEQDVFVKYTTAPVVSPVINGLPATQELSEPVGKRVPTFYETHGEAVTKATLGKIRTAATNNRP
ncbi:MAG: hypothetical protein WKF81_02310 [Thermomicrobiales bacterium]